MTLNLLQNTPLVTLGGSWAYGTQTNASDVDLLGVCIPPIEYFYGFNHTFEQEDRIGFCEEFRTHLPPHIQSEKPLDVKVFDIRKFFRLAIAANPTVLDMLFAPAENILAVDNAMGEILAHRNEFLSQKVFYVCNGLVTDQHARMSRRFKETGAFDLKDAAHTIRIGGMAYEILTTGTYNPRHTNVAGLHAIRNGEWEYPAVLALMSESSKKLQGVHTHLPAYPDIPWLENLCVETVSQTFQTRALR
jgi:hypothetical protein